MLRRAASLAIVGRPRTLCSSASLDMGQRTSEGLADAFGPAIVGGAVATVATVVGFATVVGSAASRWIFPADGGLDGEFAALRAEVAGLRSNIASVDAKLDALLAQGRRAGARGIDKGSP